MRQHQWDKEMSYANSSNINIETNKAKKIGLCPLIVAEFLFRLQ